MAAYMFVVLKPATPVASIEGCFQKRLLRDCQKLPTNMVASGRHSLHAALLLQDALNIVLCLPDHLKKLVQPPARLVIMMARKLQYFYKI